jgi:hypothetical protein
MGQVSDLRLGKRITLFITGLAEWRLRLAWPAAFHKGQRMWRRESPVDELHSNLVHPRIGAPGVGNPTKAPSFSQHVGDNRRHDHGGFRGLARRNVDAVSARVVAGPFVG